MDTFDEASIKRENPQSDIDSLFIVGSRHDRHRIEVQYGFDGTAHKESKNFAYDVDFVLFAPRSLGLLETEDFTNIRQDFQSYVRLHTNNSDPKDEESTQRVKDRLQILKKNLKIDGIRVFAVEFEGYLRAFIKRTRKEISKFSQGADLLSQIGNEVESVASLIQDFRSLLNERKIFEKDISALPADSVDHDLFLLNEYISHHYVQFLVGLEFSSRMLPQTEQLCLRLRELEAAEYSFRQTNHFLIEERNGPHSSAEEDLYLRRISLLKKYFHKPLYVHTQGEGIQRRLLIPVYALSAAFAASWMIMVQLYQANSLTQRLGINSIFIIGLGILAYVVKDIFKELMRRYFYRTGNKWFPDYEKSLFLQSEYSSAQIPFGVIKEYVRTLDSSKLPAQLRSARYSHFGGEIEESLFEDVLHFKKRVELDLSKIDQNVEFPWGLREILRYRFDRLLPSMEDAFKNIYLVSKAGIGSSRQGHRVYHVYMACWIHKRNIKNDTNYMKPAFKAYRVTLDKSGILACDSVKWEQQFGIPPIP